MIENDTEWTKLPVCPYCGACDDAWHECGDLNHDGDAAIHECGDCGREYKVTMSVAYHFDTIKQTREPK